MGNCFKSQRNENDPDEDLLRDNSSSPHNILAVQGHTGPAALIESTGSIPQVVSSESQTTSPSTQNLEARPNRPRGPRGNSLPGASEFSQVPHGFGGHGAHTRRRYHADSAGPGPLIYYPAPNVKRRVEQLSEEEQIRIAKRLGIIQQLPTYEMTESLLPTLVEKNRECIICMCEYAAGETVRTLPCLHSFHRQCIDDWLQRALECPTCQQQVELTFDLPERTLNNSAAPGDAASFAASSSGASAAASTQPTDDSKSTPASEPAADSGEQLVQLH